MRRAGLAQAKLESPVVTSVDVAMMGRAERLATRLWSVARRLPLVGTALRHVFPVLQAVGLRPAGAP